VIPSIGFALFIENSWLLPAIQMLFVAQSYRSFSKTDLILIRFQASIMVLQGFLKGYLFTFNPLMSMGWFGAIPVLISV